MERAKIRSEAKEKIKGNIWNLLWPALLIIVLEIVVDSILRSAFGVVVSYENATDIISVIKANPAYYVINLFVGMVYSTILVGYYKYVMDFVRKGEFDVDSILKCLKEKWLKIFCVVFIIEFITEFMGVLEYFLDKNEGFVSALLYMLLVIGVIILLLGLFMAKFIIADTNLGPIEALKKSWNMMKGYKWDLFCFIFSFIGWIILIPFTLLLILIWLIPYAAVAFVLYYEKLKKVKKLKKD